MSLRQLFLVVPSILIAFVIVMSVEEIVFMPTGDTTSGYENYKITLFQLRIAKAQQRADRPWNEGDVNKWLAGSLPPPHELSDEPLLSKKDVWGRPYRFVRLPGKWYDYESIGIYSLGRDGVSKTQGNDLDDINSWDDELNQLYISEAAREERTQTAIRVGILTPMVFAVLLLCGRGFRKPTR